MGKLLKEIMNLKQINTFFFILLLIFAVNCEYILHSQ